ncbi:myosin heavy chain, clone 203-like, partial [Tachysurus ichikawai]
LERRQQQVDQLVQEAKGGTEEKIREAERLLDLLQWQYNNTVYQDKVNVFCSEKRRPLSYLIHFTAV